MAGVNTVNDVPQAPFDGFQPPAREQFALTVENICLQNIYPPLLPRTTVVASDVADHVCVQVSLHTGRIVDAVVRAVVNKPEGVHLPVDYEKDQTALVELWRVHPLK